ncbi:MAG: hypothetical protein ACK4QW_16710 [Alphaproteobacteria bacterium]
MLMLAAIAVLAALLGGVAGKVMEAQDATALDRAVSSALDPYRVDPLVPLFREITRIGDSPTLLARP